MTSKYCEFCPDWRGNQTIPVQERGPCRGKVVCEDCGAEVCGPDAYNHLGAYYCEECFELHEEEGWDDED